MAMLFGALAKNGEILDTINCGENNYMIAINIGNQRNKIPSYSHIRTGKSGISVINSNLGNLVEPSSKTSVIIRSSNSGEGYYVYDLETGKRVSEFYDYMTAREYLLFCSEITAIPKNERVNLVAEMLQLVGLTQDKRKIKGFSRGMKQRLGIAQALLNKPAFLICDEPTSALDPTGRIEFLALLASLKDEVTILFSTHILSDVERICDYVGILDQGALQVVGTLESLKERYAKPQIELNFETQIEAQQFAAKLSDKKIQCIDSQVLWSYEGTYSQAFRDVVEILLQEAFTAKSISHIAPSLEQIYLEVTK